MISEADIIKDVARRLDSAEIRRKTITFEDTNLYITAPEDLILSKLYWAKESLSELQLSDVRNLLKSVDALDKDYLKKWADYLGVYDIYEKAKA